MNYFSKIERWEVIVFLVCAVILGAYFVQQIDFENMLKKDSPVPVHMGGEVRPSRPLSDVEVISVPPYVYESLKEDTRYRRYLTGNHKYILLFTYPGCGYSRAYTHALKQLFQERGFDRYYRKRIITVGQRTSASCPDPTSAECATMWIFENCFGELCILNPQRKEVVVDHSQKAGQLAELLEKYREW
jgi:hypothetical protein